MERKESLKVEAVSKHKTQTLFQVQKKKKINFTIIGQPT
jgi:hypothetical protein